MGEKYNVNTIRMNMPNIVSIRFGIISGFIIGSIIYFLVCGYEILDPTYTDWLVTRADFSLPYYGLRFYLRSNSGFNSIQGMTYPYSISPIFADLNILLSIMLKLFSSVLPVDFQIQGIVTLLDFILQGVFAGLIARKYTKNKYIVVIMEVFLAISPWFLLRLFYHFALEAQWVILAGLCIWTYNEELDNKSYILWCVLIPLSSMICLYYVPMLAGIMFFSYFNLFLEKRIWKKAIISELIAGSISVLLVFLLNGFDTTVCVPDTTYERLGHVNVNLNAFFNSLGYSRFFQGMPQPSGYPYQGYEGYAYLGLGIMCIIVIDVLLVIIKHSLVWESIKLHKYWVLSVVACALIFILFSIGICITYSDNVIIEFSLPVILRPILATFRCIGRYIWVPCYIILFLSILLFARLSETIIDDLKITEKGKNILRKYIPTVLLGIIIFLQVLDIKPLLEEKHMFSGKKIHHEILARDKRWNELIIKHEYVAIMQGYDVSLANPSINDINLLVINNNLEITMFNVAHSGNVFVNDAKTRLNEILQDQADSRAIYIFGDESMFQQAGDHIHCEIIDGYMVGWVEQ